MELDLDFKTTLKKKEIDINNINKFFGFDDYMVDIDTDDVEATICYTLEPEAREWGIKYISIMVTKITATINWWCYVDDLTKEEIDKLIVAGGIEQRDDTICGTIEIVSDKEIKGKSWDIENNLEFSKDGGLIINDLQIDMEDLTMEVS